MTRLLPVIALIAAAPALAEEKRSLDSHEHGVGTLNIAVDGNDVAMEFHAPGADIVGFEYAASTAEDRAAIDAAVAALARPLDLFALPAAAACSVTKASAGLEAEAEGHDAHHDDDGHDENGHDEHAHDDHGHGDHKDEEHAGAHDHDDHADEAGGHTEFHAEYALICYNSDALTEITFTYFDQFENAREVEVQVITATGAQAFEVARDTPVLDLRSLF